MIGAGPRAIEELQPPVLAVRGADHQPLELVRAEQARAGAGRQQPAGLQQRDRQRVEVLVLAPALDLVVAAADDAVSRRVVERLGGRTFRLYRNRDVIGVELAGALKNIVAIVAGAVEELGAGDNAKAAITTRGLAEMTRLGVAMGANPLTFAGLAGIGDILATSTSALSRNHRLGVELASGRTWDQIEGTLPGVAEGAYTVRAAVALAERHEVDRSHERLCVRGRWLSAGQRAGVGVISCRVVWREG